MDSLEKPLTDKKRSKTAIIITGIYLLIAVFSFTVMILAGQSDTFAAIFAITVSLPWSMGLSWVTDTFGYNSAWFNIFFLICGTVLNAILLYLATTWLVRRVVN